MARAVEITEQGSFIPASQRPDGSWRKPRRVKEGYVPQEEVPLYESKGKQWANSRSRQYPVGMDPAIIKAREDAKAAAAAKGNSSIPGLVVQNEGKKKKKKKKTGGNETDESVPEKSAKTDTTNNSSEKGKVDEWQTVPSKNNKASKAETIAQSSAPVATDPAKKLKNLKKKLREIEAIETKIESGEIKKPDKDQIEKVNRKSDVLSEIFALELSLGSN